MTDSTNLKQIEKSDNTGLAWVCVKSDNFLVQNLKQMVGVLAHAVKKEAEQAEKDIKRAKKVFNGR